MNLIQPLASDTEGMKPEISVKGAPLKEKENKSVTMGGEHLPCANNCDDGGFDADCRGTTGKNEEVDVIGCKEGDSTVVVKAEDPDADATEYSSSFGDTFSGSDEGLTISANDAEVESPLCVQNGHQRAFDGPVRLFRKKKVADNWKKFISPLMWRCQWLELRMNELQSQASRYDKELAAYRHEKQLQLKMIDLNDSVSRSVPLTSKTYRKPAMKRRKRRRNEDSSNILSYMSSHSIFSYYENKRCETDGLSVDDDFSDPVDDTAKGSEDYLWALDFREEDHSIEQILWNIEVVHSRVPKLKARINQVRSLTVRDMALGSSFMGDQHVSSGQSPSCSPGINGHAMQVGVPNSPTNHASDYEMDDVVLPGSAVSSFGDAPDLDIIESTMGLLSGADGPLSANQLEEFCKDDSDDVLISNQAADEELQSFEVSHVREKPREDPAIIEEPNSDDESTAPAYMASEPADEGPEGVRLTAPPQPFYTTSKRRGRKPKRRRRGGGSVMSWNVERLQKKRRLSG